MTSPPRNISPAIGIEAIIFGARHNIFQCCDITIFFMLNLADETACVHILVISEIWLYKRKIN